MDYFQGTFYGSIPTKCFSYTRGIIWVIYTEFYGLNVVFILSYFKHHFCLSSILTWTVQAVHFINTALSNLFGFFILIAFKPGLHNFVIKLGPLRTKKEDIITSVGEWQINNKMDCLHIICSHCWRNGCAYVHLELPECENLALKTLCIRHKKVTVNEPEEEVALNTQIGNNFFKNTLAAPCIVVHKLPVLMLA